MIQYISKYDDLYNILAISFYDLQKVYTYYHNYISRGFKNRLYNILAFADILAFIQYIKLDVKKRYINITSYYIL